LKRKVIFLIMILSFVMVNAKIDTQMVNKRVLEMKMELKKELHKKKYGNDVVGSYEIIGNEIKLEAYMLPIAKRIKQKGYNILEIRELDDFSKILKSKNYLPKYSIDESRTYPIKEIFGGGILFLLTLLMGIRRNNIKKNKKKSQKSRENKGENKELKKAA